MKKELFQKKTSLDYTAWVLVIAGSLNWLLFGMFKFNIVEKLFREGFLARLLYIMVGAAAIYLVMNSKHTDKESKSE